jgi:hypothetical protein
MQDQEKKFLGAILYIGMLVVCFAGGVAYQFKFEPLPTMPEVIEVTKLVSVPQVIETERVVEVQGECPAPIKAEEKQGWFK